MTRDGSPDDGIGWPAEPFYKQLRCAGFRCDDITATAKVQADNSVVLRLDLHRCNLLNHLLQTRGDILPSAPIVTGSKGSSDGAARIYS